MCGLPTKEGCVAPPFMWIDKPMYWYVDTLPMLSLLMESHFIREIYPDYINDITIYPKKITKENVLLKAQRKVKACIIFSHNHYKPDQYA